MSRTTPPNGPRRPFAMSPERLRELLDAYGAAPARWPEAEREAGRRLIEETAAARTLWEDAAALDHLLDAMPAAPPSAALLDRVLGTIPHRRVARAWRRALLAVVPLAAAAALVLWIAGDRQPARDAASALSVALGEYGSPTDVLLQAYGIDVSAAVPAIGCADSALGCPTVERGAGPLSQQRAARSLRA